MFIVNGRTYRPREGQPVVGICLDGSADEYFGYAMARGCMPHLARMCERGWRGLARAAMPTFTNVNNTSIVTGVPPSRHGILGNFFYDVERGEEVMMNSSAFLRADTIFPHAQRAGRRVAVVTAKEKLRDIFAKGLIEAGGIAFSSEQAHAAMPATHGIGAVERLVGPTPPIYSAEASLYVLRAGVALLRKGLADFLYLSTSDYVQHMHAPHEAEAVRFYAAIDLEIGRLLEGHALVAITADHGMNAKQNADGAPNVIFLESELVAAFGDGFRVILPITDPYVVHHGALGSFAQVHVPRHADPTAVREWVVARDGITECHERSAAARLMELPEDRMGDLVVASGRDVVLGRTPNDHDLTALAAPLRSHGGRYEEMVPFMLSAPLTEDYTMRVNGDIRNFDIFDAACNGTRGQA